MRPYSSPLAYVMNISSPFTFNRTGKLEALSSTWIHNALSLNDYELIVVTKGTLYLQFQDIKYTVTANQYLLLRFSLQQKVILQTTKKAAKDSANPNAAFTGFIFPVRGLLQRTSLFPL